MRRRRLCLSVSSSLLSLLLTVGWPLSTVQATIWNTNFDEKGLDAIITPSQFQDTHTYADWMRATVPMLTKQPYRSANANGERQDQAAAAFVEEPRGGGGSCNLVTTGEAPESRSLSTFLAYPNSSMVFSRHTDSTGIDLHMRQKLYHTDIVRSVDLLTRYIRSYSLAMDQVHYCWFKAFAVPKVTIPLGTDELGRPVSCTVWGRAIEKEMMYDDECKTTFGRALPLTLPSPRRRFV